MLEKYQLNKVEWINITSPTPEDIETATNIFHLHPVLSEELSRPSDRLKVENIDGLLYIIYHLPIYDYEQQTSKRSEIDLIITKNKILSITYEPIVALEEFKYKFKQDDFDTTAEFLYQLLYHINQFSLRELNHIEKKINAIETKLFVDKNYQLAEYISYLKRDILTFTLVVTPQKHLLESLIDAGSKFWGEETKIYFNNILGDYLRINYLLENLKGTIESFSITISQLYELNLSKSMRQISIFAVLFSPLLLFGTIALQPFIADFFTKNNEIFWHILIILIIAEFITVWIFHKKHLL
ncbi:MAG: magnesium transporter CorA family protein [Minisyncoccia bacterium]